MPFLGQAACAPPELAGVGAAAEMRKLQSTLLTGAPAPPAAPWVVSEGQGGLRYITQVTLASDVSVKARKFFTRLGVNMLDPPGKSVFFNDRLGLLFVRATESDLDTIERAVDALNNGAPPPVDAQTNSDNSITNAAILVRDGKLLYEMGKLDAAEDKLRAAMQLDPDNVGASYYLNLIQQAKSRREAALPTGGGCLADEFSS